MQRAEKNITPILAWRPSARRPEMRSFDVHIIHTENNPGSKDSERHFDLPQPHNCMKRFLWRTGSRKRAVAMLATLCANYMC